MRAGGSRPFDLVSADHLPPAQGGSVGIDPQTFSTACFTCEADQRAPGELRRNAGKGW